MYKVGHPRARINMLEHGFRTSARFFGKVGHPRGQEGSCIKWVTPGPDEPCLFRVLLNALGIR